MTATPTERLMTASRRLGVTLQPSLAKHKSLLDWSLEETPVVRQYHYPDPWWATIDSIRNSSLTQTTNNNFFAQTSQTAEIQPPETTYSVTVEYDETDPPEESIDDSSILPIDEGIPPEPQGVTDAVTPPPILDGDDDYTAQMDTYATDDGPGIGVHTDDFTFHGFPKSAIDDNMQRIIARAGRDALATNDTELNIVMGLDEDLLALNKLKDQNRTRKNKAIIINDNGAPIILNYYPGVFDTENQEVTNKTEDNVKSNLHLPEKLVIIPNDFGVRHEEPADALKFNLNILGREENKGVNVVFNKLVESTQFNVSGNKLTNLNAIQLAGIIKNYLEKSPSTPEQLVTLYPIKITSKVVLGHRQGPEGTNESLPLLPGLEVGPPMLPDLGAGPPPTQPQLVPLDPWIQNSHPREADLPTNLVDWMRDEMKRRRVGYFSIAASFACRRLAALPEPTVRLLCLSMETEHTRLMTEDRVLTTFGPKFREALEKIIKTMVHLPPEYVSDQAYVLFTTMNNRRDYMTHSFNSIIDFVDSLFNEAEGEGLLRAVELLHQYPNTTQNSYEVLKTVTVALFAPYKRESGTVKKQILVDSLENEISKISAATNSDINRIIENVQNDALRSNVQPDRRYFNNQTRFLIVEREMDGTDKKDKISKMKIGEVAAVTNKYEDAVDGLRDDATKNYVKENDKRGLKNVNKKLVDVKHSAIPKTTRKLKPTSRMPKPSKKSKPFNVYNNFVKNFEITQKSKNDMGIIFTKPTKPTTSYKLKTKMKGNQKHKEFTEKDHEEFDILDYFADEEEWILKIEKKKGKIKSGIKDVTHSAKDKITKDKIKTMSKSSKQYKQNVKPKNHYLTTDDNDFMKQESNIKTKANLPRRGDETDIPSYREELAHRKDFPPNNIKSGYLNKNYDKNAFNYRYSSADKTNTNIDKTDHQIKIYTYDTKRHKIKVNNKVTVDFGPLNVAVSYTKSNIKKEYETWDETSTITSSPKAIFGHLDEEVKKTNKFATKRPFRQRPFQNVINNYNDDFLEEDSDYNNEKEAMEIKTKLQVNIDNNEIIRATKFVAGKLDIRTDKKYIKPNHYKVSGPFVEIPAKPAIDHTDERLHETTDFSKSDYHKNSHEAKRITVKREPITTKVNVDKKSNGIDRKGRLKPKTKTLNKNIEVSIERTRDSNNQKNKPAAVTKADETVTILIKIHKEKRKHKKVTEELLQKQMLRKRQHKRPVYVKDELFNEILNLRTRNETINKTKEIFTDIYDKVSEYLYKLKRLSDNFQVNGSKEDLVKLNHVHMPSAGSDDGNSDDNNDDDYNEELESKVNVTKNVSANQRAHFYTNYNPHSKHSVKNNLSKSKDGLKLFRMKPSNVIKKNSLKSNTNEFKNSYHKQFSRLNQSFKIKTKFKFPLYSKTKLIRHKQNITRDRHKFRHLNKSKSLDGPHRIPIDKIRDFSSYSDEEKLLKSNIDDALRHGDKYLRNIRRSNYGIAKDNIMSRFNKFSSYSNEEVVLKSNIYKSFGFGNHSKGVFRANHVSTKKLKLKFDKLRPVNEISSYSDEENVLRDKLKLY